MILTLAASCCWTAGLQAQISKVQLLQPAVVQYEKAEWAIELTADFNNPYLQEEVSLDMQLLAPSGKKLVLPCYYESGKSGAVSSWKARFAAREKGKYRYSFLLKQRGGQPMSSSEQSFSARPSRKDGILHAGDNWVFRFDSGKPFRGIGENICWESRASDDSKYFSEMHQESKYNYEEMLPMLKANGGNYFRTWICSWNLPIDWRSGFNNHRYTASTEYYNPSALAKMDRMVDLCDSLELYVMLTMGPGAYHTRDAGAASSAADFFVNPAAREKYRNRLRYIVARWGYSSAIGAWEFFNEVDNVQFGNKEKPIPAADIVQWHNEMSQYLKSVDPYQHLVTTSISHRDLEGMNSLPDIDFNQRHMYRVTTQMPGTIIEYARNFKKPYVIGEFSYEWDWSKDFNQFADSMDYDYKRGLWYGLFSPTPVLPLSWWWEYFDSRKTDRYIAHVRTIQDRMMKAGNGQFDSIPVVLDKAGVEKFAVRCGKEIYVYLNNRSADAKTLNCTVPAAGLNARTVSVYECEKGVYGTALIPKIAAGQLQVTDLTLPASTDLVLIFTK